MKTVLEYLKDGIMYSQSDKRDKHTDRVCPRLFSDLEFLIFLFLYNLGFLSI